MHVSSQFSPFSSQLSSPWLNPAGHSRPEAASENHRHDKPIAVAQPDVAATESKSQLWGSSLAQSRSITLQVRTREGDVVDVEIGASDSSSKALYQASQGGSQVLAGASESSTESHLSLRVQGNLSEDELKSLTDLVDKVQTLADKFFDGDAHAAFAHAGNLGMDTSTLSAFSLNMSQTETRYEVQAYQQVSGLTGGGSSPPAQTAPASLTQPIGGFMDSLSSVFDAAFQSGLFGDPKSMLADLLNGIASMDDKKRQKAAAIEQSTGQPFKALTQDLVDVAAAPSSTPT